MGWSNIQNMRGQVHEVMHIVTSVQAYLSLFLRLLEQTNVTTRLILSTSDGLVLNLFK